MVHSLHSRIKSRRRDCGLSQEQLAKACGVGQSTVANWELGGHIPRQATLSRIAKALKIDQAWLVTGEHAANHGPVNDYLNTPIRHIPVYDWPQNAQEFSDARPQRYITMTVEADNVFALLAPKSGTEFKGGTILTFTRNYSSENSGTFLCINEDTATLLKAVTGRSDVEARLIFSLTPH